MGAPNPKLPILFYMLIVSMNATIFEFKQPYLTWKGRGLFANSIGVTAGNRRPLTNKDSSNDTLQHFGLPRPIKHYRRGYSIGNTPSTTSSTGGNLVSQLMDTPGGFILQQNEEENVACKGCQGIAVTSEWNPNTNLTETPSPQTQAKRELEKTHIYIFNLLDEKYETYATFAELKEQIYYRPFPLVLAKISKVHHLLKEI